MSDEVSRVEEQLRRSFESGAWHGPAVLEALAGVSHEDAYAHPIAGAHSIWELVLHLEGTYRLVLRRLQGDDAPLAAEEDWPMVPAPTAEAWRDAVRALHLLNQELRSAVRAFPASRLDEPLVAQPPYPWPTATAHTQFIGVTQHDLYHAGQIAILKRALAASRPEGSEHADDRTSDVSSFEAGAALLKGGFRIGAPADVAFPLFSPLGEKAWVPGWNPELLHRREESWAQGMIFRTAGERGDAIWIITRLEPQARRVEYRRVEPGRYVVRVGVHCTPEGPGATAVATEYEFVGLSESGNAEIASMTQEAYAQKMQQWAQWIQACLEARRA